MKDADRVRAEYEAKLNDQEFLRKRLDALTAGPNQRGEMLGSSGYLMVMPEPDMVSTIIVNPTPVAVAPESEPELPPKPKRSHHKGSN